MKKKVLSLLLALAMVLSLLPTMALADGEVAGTLQFSYDLPAEYTLSKAGYVYDWGNVAVGTYTPDGGEAMPIPSGVYPTLVWYQSTDGVNWNAAPYMPWDYISSSCYYKVEASAVIDGQTYTGTSTIVHVLVRAADIKVNFTLSDAGLIASDTLGRPVANQSITVVDLNADGKHTYDEALSALHKASAKNGTDDYDTEEGAYGLQVKKLWGKETTAALFYKNGAALEKNVGEETVAANDNLYAAILSDTTYYADVYTAFNVASKDITLGQTCELTLTDISGNPVPDVQIGTLEDGNFVALDGKKTDANGKVVVKPETAGTLYITAKGTVKADVVTEYNDDWTPKTIEKLDCPIMAPACVVTTHEAGELTVAVSTKTAQLEYYVGESSSLNYRFTVSYKIDGKSDSAITNRAKNKIEYWRIAVDKDGNETGEAEKIASISAKFTEADKGMWHYFAKTTVDAYGVEMSAESEKLPVLITEESLQGSCANGYVTELIYQKDSNLQEKLTITDGITDFNIEELDMSNAESIMVFADNEKAAGDTFYFGYRVDGKQTSSSGDSKYRPADGASLNFRMANSYQAKPAGTVVTYSVLIGTKYDSDGDGSISGKDHYKACDIYNFRTITKPSFSGLAVADAAGNTIALDTPITGFVNGSALGTASDMIKLTPTLGTGVTMYIGNEETGYASGETATVNLSVYKNEKDVAVIPLTLKAGSGDAAIENAYTLHVHPVIETPVITKQSETVSVDKGKTVKISVEAKEPAEGTLEYQWYTYASDGWTVVAIEGATSAEYDAPSLERVHQYEWQNSQTFWCEVSVVSGDYKNTVKSNNVTVTTNMTYVSEPLFTIQPGILGDKNMNGSYVKTYTAGSSFNSMFFGISNPEPGCTNAAFKCFYNNTDTTDGGTEIPGTYSSRMTGGNFDNYYEFQPSMTLPEGTYYVYFTAETHLDKDEQQTATAKSKTVKLEFEPYKIPFDGSGTEIDPFLIKTAGDMDTLSELVGIQGINFGGSYLRMENDITLSTGWTPVGRLKDSNITGIKDGTNMNAFGGVFDGNGHTLTIPENEAPAFGYVRGATIRNLNIYGTKINGYGLINNMEGVHLDGTAVIVDNVTLKSGTQTRFSGITGSRCTESAYAGVSAGYVTTIKNCTIEEGCVIGYEGTQTGIGSFAGRLQGTVENCVSYAEVKGADYVGGIIGTRDNALGNCNVKNCEFYGTVAGTNNVGGIVGGGYYDMTTDHNTAPNADRIDITGCTFGGTVKGTKNVGGIIGGDEYVAQLWDKGVLTGNKATGKIEGSVNVGAIIGHYFSLNKFDEISGNIYAEECGVEKGIGKIDYIDTNCSAPTAVSGTTYINTENGTSGCPAVEGCNWKPQHNRTDDPLGADAEKLCRVSEDAEPVCYELVMTGTPKTEYYIGDEIDLTGLTFTAKWTQGKEDTTVDASELTVEGFDSSTRKVMDVTVKYGDTSTTFTVTVLNRPDPTASTITVYFTLLGDTKHGEDGTVHTLKANNLTTWIARESYEMDINATVKDLLDAVEAKHSNVKFNGKGSQYGTYIESVTYGELTIGEFDNTATSGWMVAINGKHPDAGVDYEFLNNGDKVIFHFTDDYTKEQSSEEWNTPDPSSPNKEDKAAASKVVEAIDAIGTVTKDSKDTIEAARKAYNALTDAQKKLVTNYGKLVTAEKALAELNTQSVEFIDVADDAWYADAVDYVSSKGIMMGTAEQIFSPNVELSRAMLVTILARIDGKNTAGGDTWYAKGREWAMENGISDGTNMMADITREQVVAMLFRYAQKLGLDTTVRADLSNYEDADQVSDWAVEAMRWAVGAGLVQGTSNTTISPKGTATRAQAATFIMRFMEDIIK